MASKRAGDAPSFVIEIEPGLRERVAAAAAAQDIPVKDYVASVLREALDHHEVAPAAEQAREWSRLSVSAFARDWESDADAVYDDLA